METTTRRIILALLGLLQRASPALLYLSKILSRVPSQERKNLSQVKNNIFDHAVLTPHCECVCACAEEGGRV